RQRGRHPGRGGPGRDHRAEGQEADRRLRRAGGVRRPRVLPGLAGRRLLRRVGVADAEADEPHGPGRGAGGRAEVLRRRPAEVTSRGRSGARERWAYAPYLLPGLLLFTAVIGVPFLMNIGTSFTEWTGVGTPKWIGLGNYRELA